MQIVELDMAKGVARSRPLGLAPAVWRESPGQGLWRDLLVTPLRFLRLGPAACRGYGYRTRGSGVCG